VPDSEVDRIEWIRSRVAMLFSAGMSDVRSVGICVRESADCIADCPFHRSSRRASPYGAAPVQLRTLGGTVPIAPFIDALGFPAVIVPVVNFDNNQHEENENLRLGNLFDAIVTFAAILRMQV